MWEFLWEWTGGGQGNEIESANSAKIDFELTEFLSVSVLVGYTKELHRNGVPMVFIGMQ